jgi:hypothetical protein
MKNKRVALLWATYIVFKLNVSVQMLSSRLKRLQCLSKLLLTADLHRHFCHSYCTWCVDIYKSSA